MRILTIRHPEPLQNNTYLTCEVVKSGKGWQISFKGLPFGQVHRTKIEAIQFAYEVLYSDFQFTLNRVQCQPVRYHVNGTWIELNVQCLYGKLVHAIDNYESYELVGNPYYEDMSKVWKSTLDGRLVPVG